MSEKSVSILTKRRSFLGRLSAGVTAFAAAAVTGATVAQGQSPAGGRWQPERHETDDWLDKLPGRHRLVFDTTTPAGFGEAILFANNFMTANKTGYGVGDEALAIVIIARHNSTSFAYKDAMWAKYGLSLSLRTNFTDPKNRQAPKVNLYNAADYGVQLANRGTTIDTLAKRGVHFAVCQMATRGIAGSLAEATGGNTDTIYNELVANIVTNAHMVPAGIVAVSRAQERGYTLVSA
jgi:intracellular sulfur oxidation DsrE/DsrF family protein